MAKILLRRQSATEADIVSVIRDDYDFGSSEVPPKYWRFQVTDVTYTEITNLMSGLNETVNCYDLTTFIATIRRSLEGSYHIWFFDLTDAPAAYATQLEAGDTLALTANTARFEKLFKSRTDGRALTPADFNAPDHTPQRERDDDIRNLQPGILPPELGGEQGVWDAFIVAIQDGMYGEVIT
jgi:hypothetical protein